MEVLIYMAAVFATMVILALTLDHDDEQNDKLED